MSASSRPAGLWWVFAGTILLSAFLLFLVQPIIAKALLPWFGGSTGVWATCVVFFQVLLCAGYAYAHAGTRWLTRKQQLIVHLCVLGVATVSLVRFVAQDGFMSIMPDDAWRPIDGTSPASRIMLLLLRFVGLPYFALSSTGPLLQAWFARCFPEKTPYRLYALSNFGSLGSLLMFPFLFESNFGLRDMAFWWSIGFGLFAVACAFAAWKTYQITGEIAVAESAKTPEKIRTASEERAAAREPQPRTMDVVSWIFLPALATYMLLAGTNHLCQDVASVPFLWVLPLSLYLLSFIVCFDHERWYVRPLFAMAALIGLYAAAAMNGLDFNSKQTYSKGLLTRGSYPFAKPLYEKAEWSEAESDSTSKAPVEVHLSEKELEYEEKARTAWLKYRPLDYDDIPLQPGEYLQSQTWIKRELGTPPIKVEFYGQIVVHCFALFGVFMLCHGELTRRKPGPKHLTAFYLWIALGGALGGAFVSMAAPVLFNDYTEWFIGLMLCIVLASALVLDQPMDRWYPARFLLLAVPCGLIVLSIVWQNSSLPIRFLEWRSPEMFTALGGEELISEEMLSAKYAFAASAFVITAIALGFYVLATRAKWREYGGFWAVNLVVLCLVCVAVYDSLGFLGLRDVWKEYRKRADAVTTAAPEGKSVFIPGVETPVVVPLDKVDNPDERFYEVEQIKHKARNFYGAITITDNLYPNDPDLSSKRQLNHGRIMHGTQFLDPEQREAPTTYYVGRSGVGRAIGYFANNPTLKVAAIGMGTGTLAAYARKPGDKVVFYEINPMIPELSAGEKPWFFYLQDATEKRNAAVDVVLGDARLCMQREVEEGKSGEYDVLVVDAFSGDAIPTHLLALEAMDIYDKQLRSDGKGVLAIHISNRFFNLKKVCRAMAEHAGYKGMVVKVDDDYDGGSSSTWVLLTKNQDFLDALQTDPAGLKAIDHWSIDKIVWNDDFTALTGVLGEPDDDETKERVVLRIRRATSIVLNLLNRFWNG